MLGHPSSILDWQSGGLFVGGILWNLISRDLQKWMHITTVSSVFQLKDTGIDTETVRSQGALFFFFFNTKRSSMFGCTYAYYMLVLRMQHQQTVVRNN